MKASRPFKKTARLPYKIPQYFRAPKGFSKNILSPQKQRNLDSHIEIPLFFDPRLLRRTEIIPISGRSLCLPKRPLDVQPPAAGSAAEVSAGEINEFSGISPIHRTGDILLWQLIFG